MPQVCELTAVAKVCSKNILCLVVLKLVERKGNQEEKQLNLEIANLIGRRTCMHDFDTMGTEVCGWLCTLVMLKLLRNVF